MNKLLLLDSDALTLEVLGRTLNLAGYQCYGYQNPVDAMNWLQEGHDVDAVITDLKMPDMDGLEFIRLFQQTHPEVSILATTACLTQELKCKDCGLNVAFMRKPMDLHKVLEWLIECRATRENSIAQENNRTNFGLGEELLDNSFVLEMSENSRSVWKSPRISLEQDSTQKNRR